MAASTVSPISLNTKEKTKIGSVAQKLLPSYTDFFFVSLVVWLFSVGVGWKGLMLDGDTGWHIRTGEYILRHGSVPSVDLFSFSRAGQSWFAWEWLSDIIFAAVHARFHLAGVAVVGGLVISASAILLLRQMVARGAHTFLALLLTLLFVGGASLHFHARPHVFTLAFLAVFTWVINKDRQAHTRALWLLIPLSALWTNLHGGFLAGVAYAGLVAVGTGCEALFRRQGTAREAGRYGILAAACLVASLANPYGWQLHKHVADYLQSDFIRSSVQEFQSPSFRGETAMQFEIVLLVGLCVAGVLIARGRWAEALPVVYFAHASLGAARHIPLFLIVVSPIVALELTAILRQWTAGFSRNSVVGILDQLSTDFGAGFRRTTVWLPLGIAALLFLTPPDRWPTDFGLAGSFPDKMLNKHRELIATSRVFTSDQWGDYLIYHLPSKKVFIDGRSDFYGESLGKEYLSLMNLDSRWSSVIDKHKFDLMLVPTAWPLGSALKLSSDWKLLADDGKALLFQRVAGIR